MFLMPQFPWSILPHHFYLNEQMNSLQIQNTSMHWLWLWLEFPVILDCSCSVPSTKWISEVCAACKDSRPQASQHLPVVLGTCELLGKWVLFKQKATPLFKDNYFVQLSFCTSLSQNWHFSESGKVSAQCQVQWSLLFSLKQKGFKYILPSWQQWQMGL
jgi:hypothetical protein